MRKLVVILLLCLPFALRAQTKLSSDSGAVIASRFVDAVMYVDDVKTSKSDLSNVEASNVIEVTLLKPEFAVKKYGQEAAKGVALITTRKYAVKHYQETFRLFSDDLESWLTSHGADDAQFHYFLDGEEVKNDTDKGILTLYHLDKDKIDNVTFVQDEPEGSKYSAKIKIETKK